MDKFIYVFDTAGRDALLRAGFLMLKSSEKNSLWIFAADDRRRFDLGSVPFPYTTSNVLTF